MSAGITSRIKKLGPVNVPFEGGKSLEHVEADFRI
jgi:hypothetical protein